MRKYLFLIMCASLAIPAFAGTWTLQKDATLPDALQTDGVLVKATNIGPDPNATPVTVAGIPFDTDTGNITGGSGPGMNLDTGRFYTGDDPDLFNLLNTWHGFNVWNAEAWTIEFNDLAIGMEYRLQMLTGWPWGWCRFRIVGAEGEIQNVVFQSGNNGKGVNVATYTWTPNESSAAFIIEFPNGDNQYGMIMGYTLYATSDPFIARSPSPWNWQTGLDYDETTLSWLPGGKAIRHRIYFAAEDPCDLTVAGEVDLGFEWFDPGDLMLNTTYFWRVDELNNDSSVTTGDLWRFTTAAADQIIADPNADLFTANGAVGIVTDPNYEPDFYITYDTDNAPSYAEITHTFDTPLDLTAGGAAALAFNSLSSKQVANDAAPIYVILEDDLGASARVVTADGDTADLSWYDVATLNFAYSAFTGVDVTQVTKITIGIGNPDSPQTGKSGMLMVEDIRRFAKRYVENQFPEDLNNDQIVDLNDFAGLARDFLYGETITAVAPTEPNELSYSFNEGSGTTVADNSDNGRNLSSENIIWETSDCPDGSCITFDGTYLIYAYFWGVTTNSGEFTLAFWAKPDPDTPQTHGVVGFRANVSDVVNDRPIRVRLPNGGGNIDLYATGGGANHPLTADLAGSWHHYAFVKSIARGTVEMYIDGVLVERNTNNYDGALFASDFTLGDDDWQGKYVGKLDDFILFSTALSQEEIVYLAKGPGSSVDQPPLADLEGDGNADLGELSDIASLWLQELLWPMD